MSDCGNCGSPLIDHCRMHLIPCCPGKCPSEQEREWTITCSASFSCGWSGSRLAVSQEAASAETCPNCGAHVHASGSRPADPVALKDPGPLPSRYHLL
jgi:hypothetical protein